MTPHFEDVLQHFKRLPGLGYRSAERIALHLLVEQPKTLQPLLESLSEAARVVQRCEECGNLAEESLCAICKDPKRDRQVLCIVEQVPDLIAMERAVAFRGHYHVLHGKLSPINRIGPEELNLQALAARVKRYEVEEVVLAIGNDIEGEATCHFIQQEVLGAYEGKITRIGFGLPSGGGVVFADAATLKSALEGRKEFS